MKTLYDRLKDKEALKAVKFKFPSVYMEIKKVLKENTYIGYIKISDAMQIIVFLTNKPFDLETLENLFHYDN